MSENKELNPPIITGLDFALSITGNPMVFLYDNSIIDTVKASIGHE